MLQRRYIDQSSGLSVERAASCSPRPVPAATTAPPVTIHAAVRTAEPGAAALSGCCSIMVDAGAAAGAVAGAGGGGEFGATTIVCAAAAGFSVDFRFTVNEWRW